MKVKICGLTHSEDAFYAAELGADFIGILFAPSSKRYVSSSQAKEIVDAAKKGGAEPVGVFVDETAEEIFKICLETGIKTLQLHGALSKQAFSLLNPYYQIIYTVPTTQPITPSSKNIFLFDHSTGGSGKMFNWKNFSPPKNTKWILAGGLNPSNVSAAIKLLHPYGVDVATGVEYAFSTRKNPILVKAFIQNEQQSGGL